MYVPWQDEEKTTSTATNLSLSSTRSRQFSPASRHNVRFKTKSLLPSSSQISISPSKASEASSSSTSHLSPAPQSVLPTDNNRVLQKTTPKISTKGKVYLGTVVNNKVKIMLNVKLSSYL